MKKAGVFIFLTLLVLSLTLATAQEFPTGINEEELTDIQDIAIDEDLREEYIKEQWEKILNSTSVGKFLTSTEDFMQKGNPFFNFVFGLEFSWSFLFITALLIYITLITTIYRVTQFIAIYSKLLKLIIALGISTFLASIRFVKIIATFIVSSIEALPHWSIQLIVGFIVIIGLIFLAMYSKLLEKVFKSIGLKKKIKDAARDAKEAKKIAKSAARKNTAEPQLSEDDQIEQQAKSDIEGMSEDEGL